MSAAQISGAAIFHNGRTVDDRGKTLMFDVAFWLSDTEDEKQSLIGTLKYFNAQDLTFTDGGVFFVVANIARIEQDSLTLHDKVDESTRLEFQDYDFVGDAIVVIPTAAGTSPHFRPFVHISGVALNPNEERATFQIDADQYVAANRNVKKDGRLLSSFPVNCVILDSPLYAKKKDGSGPRKRKPVPQLGKYVVVSGFLVGTVVNGGVTRFAINVESVIFMGRPAIAPSVPHADSPTGQTPLKRKALFQFGSQGSPSPVSKQQKTSAASNALLSA